ncbi:unnamed protein product [Oreochromis niloticus]|nr:unnamed protein product [Mustela putorius furo]
MPLPQVKVLPTHDASKVRASGSGLKTTGVPTSLPVKFNIDAKDAGEGLLAVQITLLSPSRLLSICNSDAGSLQVIPSSSTSASTIHQLNSNICQLCIQLEALACCAQALGRDFRPLLTTSLYPVLEKAGEEQEDLSICQFLLNYRKQKELAEGTGIEDDDTEDREVPPTGCEDVADIGSPDVKAELPSHLSITKDVMERCIHLLSDPSLRLRLKVLDVLELCVQVLSERENELLPMAHRCWPALLQRLTADDPLAVLRAFRVGPDTFWFTLSELHCPSSYIPHHLDLQLNGTGRPRDEFSDNVFKLLKEEFGSVTETVNQPVS